MYNKEQNTDINKILDEALKTGPKFDLSDNFADLIAEKMSRKFAWRQYFSEFLIYFGAIVGLIFVTVGIQFLFFAAEWQVWTQFILNNIFIVGGIIFTLVFILFADKVLLRYFMYRSSILKE